MDNTVMYKLTYGLFVLTANDGGRDNGCIINTACQVTSEPNRVTIAVNKANLTNAMIDADGRFNISVISEKADFELFKRFGFASGRDVDKFAGFPDAERSATGLYYVTKGVNAVISGKVLYKINLDTHTLFIADVTDGFKLDGAPSATYTYYQSNIKPAPAAKQSSGTVWRCRICGWEYDESKGMPEAGIAPGTKFEDIPDSFFCPVCKHPKSDFEKVV